MASTVPVWNGTWACMVWRDSRGVYSLALSLLLCSMCHTPIFVPLKGYGLITPFVAIRGLRSLKPSYLDWEISICSWVTIWFLSPIVLTNLYWGNGPPGYQYRIPGNPKCRYRIKCADATTTYQLYFCSMLCRMHRFWVTTCAAASC